MELNEQEVSTKDKTILRKTAAKRLLKSKNINKRPRK